MDINISEAKAQLSKLVIAYHGEKVVKGSYVVMDLAQYQHLRECELEAALVETKDDLEAGRVVKESAEAHLARLDSLA